METLFATQPLGNILLRVDSALNKLNTRIDNVAPTVQSARQLVNTVRSGGLVPGTNVMFNPALQPAPAPKPNNNKTILIAGGVLLAGFLAYKYL
jgi:hypothetical protein